MNKPATSMSRLLLVDDDVELGRMLRDYLEAEGFDVSVCSDGGSALQTLQQRHFDLVVLDVMMPGLSGIEVLGRLRLRSQVPVLMLTARGDDIDRIIGLELGADDYVPKPCMPRELTARIRAILRRTQPLAAARGDAPLSIGELTISAEKRQAHWRGEVLELTSTEFNLLALLAQQAGKVVSKAELSERGLGRALARYDRSVDVHMSSIRHKLGELPDGRSCIQTIRGIGYQLVWE